MSASLVGSEMCIRDSFSGGANAPADPPKSTSKGNKMGLAPPSPPVVQACLLYTSDAADDM
eukprot:9093269-Alexandrium_andersonii.AAC.1